VGFLVLAHRVHLKHLIIRFKRSPEYILNVSVIFQKTGDSLDSVHALQLRFCIRGKKSIEQLLNVDYLIQMLLWPSCLCVQLQQRSGQWCDFTKGAPEHTLSNYWASGEGPYLQPSPIHPDTLIHTAVCERAANEGIRRSSLFTQSALLVRHVSEWPRFKTQHASSWSCVCNRVREVIGLAWERPVTEGCKKKDNFIQEYGTRRSISATRGWPHACCLYISRWPF